MPLIDVELALTPLPLPGDVKELFQAAEPRIEAYSKDNAVGTCGFIPSDYASVYRAMQAIWDSRLATGNAFCEWGSGFGVVTASAAMIGFDACGIEIEEELVDVSRELAAEFSLPVEFVHGSFIPAGGQRVAEQACIQSDDEFQWLAIETDQAYDELGLDPGDFDVVFAYPWPSEHSAVEVLFEKFAADGALLLTYQQFDALRLRRKTSRKKRRRRARR